MVINGCENGIFLTCCFFQIKEPTSCRLYLLINSEKVFVAFGTIHPELTLDHHNNLVADNVKVSVDEFEPAYKEASVPVPSQFIKKLGQALGTFTQWPTNLVSLVTSPEVTYHYASNLTRKYYIIHLCSLICIWLFEIHNSGK